MTYFHKLKQRFGSREKAALATSTVLITLDLMGGGGLFSTLGAASGIGNSGLGKIICEGLKGGLSNYLPSVFERIENTKKAEKNHTNFILFVEATQRCLVSVKELILQHNGLELPASRLGEGIIDKRKEVIQKHIIDPTFKAFGSEKIAEIFTKNDQLHPAEFIERAFDLAVDFNSIELENYKDGAENIKEAFSKIFRETFLDEIRKIVSNDPKLRDSYHTFLMHQILTANDSLKKDLKNHTNELTESLLLITKGSQIKIEAQNDILLDRIEQLVKINKSNLKKIRKVFEQNSLPKLDYVIPNYKRKKDKLSYDLGYSYRSTKFIGRDQLMYEMIDFVDSKLPFSWTMISGKAGQGKSRFAQEICDLYYAKGWHVGFCSFNKDNYNWGNLNTAKNKGLLIIVDYISGREKKVQKLLKELANETRGQKSKDPKVRVILLEREFSVNWLENTVPYLDHVKECLYKEQRIPYELNTLTEKDLLSLISYVSNSPFTEEKGSEIIQKLQEIDIEMRPLIAFIIGLKIRDKDKDKENELELNTWDNIDQPLNYILFREKDKFWDKTVLGKRDTFLLEACLFITALAQKIETKKLIEIVLKYSEEQSNLSQSEVIELYKRSSYYSKRKCHGFQPDLIAEYYIVRHLQQDNEYALEYLDATFQLEPLETKNMLLKTSQNLWNHDGFKIVDEWIDTKFINLKQLEKQELKYLVELCYDLFLSHSEPSSFNLAKSELYFYQIVALHTVFKKEKTYAKYQATGARYFIYYYLNNETSIEKALEFFSNHILKLRFEKYFENNLEIAVSQSIAAKNIIYYYLFLNKVPSLKKADEFYKSFIISLRTDNDKLFFNARDIALQQTIAASYFIYYYTTVESKIKKAETYFNIFIVELRKIKTFKKDKDITLQFIKATRFLIAYYTKLKTSNISIAFTLFDNSILKLIKKNTDQKNRDIAVNGAWAIYDIIEHCHNDFVKTEDKKLIELFELFKSVYENNPNLGITQDHVNQLNTWINNITDRYNFKLLPPLWNKVSIQKGKYIFETFSHKDILSDKDIWNLDPKKSKSLFEFYNPFKSLESTTLGIKEIQTVLYKAFDTIPNRETFRISHVIGARKFNLPFYKDGAWLFELLCQRDDEPFTQNDDAEHEFKTYGYLTFIIHGVDEKVIWLTGNSDPIHSLNKLIKGEGENQIETINIALDSRDLAEEYLNFFCSFTHGEEGAFTIINTLEDINWIDKENLDKGYTLAAINEGNTIPLQKQEGVWACRKLVRYSNTLFLSQFKIFANGMVEMLDDLPIDSGLPILNQIYVYNLKSLKYSKIKKDNKLKSLKNFEKLTLNQAKKYKLDIVANYLKMQIHKTKNSIKENFWPLEKNESQLDISSPTYNLKYKKLSLKKVEDVVLNAMLSNNGKNDFKLTKILGGREFPLPFYKDASLFEISCERDNELSAKNNIDKNPIEKYGYMTFIVYGNDQEIVWLDGKSDSIHYINKWAPIIIKNTSDANKYLNFFCSYCHGDNGAFSIIENSSDLPWINEKNQNLDNALLIAAIKESNKITIKKHGENWISKKLIYYSSSLFLADFTIKPDGFVAMDKDIPIVQGLFTLHHLYNDNLKGITSLDNKDGKPDPVKFKIIKYKEAKKEKLKFILNYLKSKKNE
ncbi:MAG: hypothetical protein V7719_11580 [Psychroserpens sp.]|uniref:hypothetical protein n=1 Tax=Psychroserpens sp. TaxID=2020870 RepID=UPI00300288ED